ncbi:Zinc finger C2HC domain-containing protein 1C [Phytophthora nicotianae]|uniref:Zinc finger C2HC domain-containing protein 1C n=1 Tax=Phytophthora nicotianae TaxID=4792 RepID=A0A0W8D975_PHYNI|nr:Zinc finger C2HC domain-containing protein 1C [Phytophthora nicotianae]
MLAHTALSAAVAVVVLAPTEALTNLKTDWDAYVSELPIPEVIDLTAGGAIDMQIGRATHNWTEDGSISGDIYGYALKNSTPTMPGPTIKVAKGVPITITWYNELSQPHLFQNSVEDSLNNVESACYPYCDTITQVCYVACTPDEYLIANSTRGAKDYGFDTTEPYVAHCHILEHEENAMMSWFKIMDVDDGYADDNGITPGTEITNTVIATAMGMSVLGGIATTLSVLVISVERLKFLADPRSLSIAFALSAGVMIFIAFADLYAEALTYYRAAFTPGTTDPEAYEHGGSTTSAGVCDDTCNGNTYLAATGVFFVGMAIILLVEWLVHSVFERKDRAAAKAAANADLEADGEKAMMADDGAEKAGVVHIASPVPGTPVDAARQELASPAGQESEALLEELKVKEEYRRAGVLTGIAIAIHNFPEGLALFVSSLAGLRTGIVLSVGIILHNFPEGVAVAAPVYYATGSKAEAFKWTIISGFAQVLGAGIGWAAVSGGMSYSLEATLYALVAGMLVCITAKELLPGAYKFDPSGKLFVPSFFIGIAIIALSLVALNYAGSS